MSISKIIFITGLIALVGNVKEGHVAPSGILRILLATLALAMILTQATGTALEKPVRMLSYLGLLAALLYYTNNIVKVKTTKVKKNG